MDIKRIIWPSDLSEASNAALPLVLEMSTKFGAEVLLLYVTQDVKQADHWYGDAEREMLGQLQQRETKMAEQMMQRICDEKLKACPGFQRFIANGNPAREITAFAQKQDADLIIMSTHGKGSGQSKGNEPGIGSTVEKVVRRTGVPVMVVRP